MAETTHATRQLEIFARRSLELADRVAAGEIPFIEAVDMAYSAAVWAGLVETVGDDVVQACLAGAFANARRPKTMADLPRNHFGAILADPPWHFRT
jgi:hypothetical protein